MIQLLTLSGRVSRPLIPCLLLFVFLSQTVKANVTITGGTTASVLSGNPYVSLASAINALNAAGSITAAVTVDVSAGHTETLSGRIVMTVTGTSSFPIVIQKSGSGLNPKLVSYTGTNATASSTADGFFVLAGSDYVTIDGIDLQENSSNTTPTTVMEFGYALFKASASDGAQHNTIKNCVITLNRIQNGNWSSTGHVGSIGIVVNNSLSTSATAITNSSENGSNSYNQFYSNTIRQCNCGIALIGYAAALPYNLGDTGNEIGGSDLTTGNTIVNFGGASAATNQSNGIFAINQWGLNCNYNHIQNNDGGGADHPNILRGIFFGSSSNGASMNCRHNQIALTSAGTTHELSGISVNVGNTGVANVVDVSHNDVTAKYPTATSGFLYGIHVNSTANTVLIANNSIHDITYGSGFVAGAGAIYPIYNQSQANNLFILENTISDINRTGLNSGGILGIHVPLSSNLVIKRNTISHISINGSGASSPLYGINLAPSGNVICDSNDIADMKITYTNAGMGLIGIRVVGSSPSESYSGNSIHHFVNQGTGLTYGMSLVSTNNGARTVSDNTIFSLLSTGVMLSQSTTVSGIYLASGSSNVFRNKIFDITSQSTASGIVTGIIVAGLISNGMSHLYNNLIGHLNAPFISTSSNGVPTIQGIGVNSTSESTILLTNNTIYLNAISSGGYLSSAGIFHTSLNTYASNIGNLLMRNNIVYNQSTPAGIGRTVAYQRSSTNLSTYHVSSDRNLFYAGTASSTHLIFSDSVNHIQSLAAYKTWMNSNGADQHAYSDSITFQTVDATQADYLKYALTTPSICESAGSSVGGITTDYAGTIRQGNAGYIGGGSMPDIGAWELNGIALSSCSGMPGPSSTITSNSNPCPNTIFILSLSNAYGLGYSMQWEASTVSVSSGFNPIAGATNENLITSSNTTTWYRCLITCVASGLSVYSSPVYVNSAMLSGSFTIDQTGAGNYLSVYEALTELNCKGASGPVIFNLIAGQIYNESNQLICSYEAGPANSVTFKKSGSGANPVIRRIGTSSINDFILQLHGADYYTFDGINFEQSGSNSTNYVEYGIHIVNKNVSNGASNNLFRNGTISLTNQTVNSKCVYIQSLFTPAALSGSNSRNRFVNMTVQQAFEGYRFTQTSSAYLDEENEINIDTTGNPTASSVIQQIGSTTLGGAVYGVYCENQRNFNLSNTELKFVNSSGLDNAVGIRSAGNPVSSVNVSNCKFHDFSAANTCIGISLGSVLKVEVLNNYIYNLNSPGFSAIGISVIGTGLVCQIKNNRISNLTTTATIAGYAIGISIGGGIFTVSNNMISELHAGASTFANGATTGIAINSAGSSTTRLYHNSIYLNDIGTVNGYTSAGIYIGVTSPEFDIRNNIVVNKSNVTIGTRAVAFWKSAVTDNIDNSSNNNLWYSGTPSAKNLIYYNGTNAIQTIAAYKALASVSPAESNAFSENISFAPIVNGILRPLASVPTVVEGGAQLINEFTNDFEGDNRHATAPDIGADEGNFTPAYSSPPSCALSFLPATSSVDLCSYQPLELSWKAPNNAVPVNQGYDLYVGTTPNPPFVANVMGLSYSLTGLLPNTTYYWKVEPKNTFGNATACSVQTFTTSNAVISSTSPASICGQGVASLTASGNGNFNWYNSPIGGSSIYTGSNFTTPVLNSTTTYFVESTSGTYQQSGGRIAPSVTELQNTVASGLVFNVTTPFVLSSVDIFTPLVSGTMTIQLQNNIGVVLQSATFTFSPGGSAVPKTIPLNFSIPVGTGYRLLQSTSFSLVRETTHPGFPYQLGSFGQITSGFTGGTTSSTYFNFYNWRINSACASPRQAVIATVTPNTSSMDTISSCDTYTWPLNGTTYTISGMYEQIAACDTQRLYLTINNTSNSTQIISAINSYTWSVSGLTYSNSGVYTYTYMNANDCIHTATLQLTLTTSGLQSVDVIQDQSVSCFGFNDGSCQAIAYPTGAYNYQLDGALSNNTGFFDGLTPGIHTICVSDGINSYCDTVLISEPAILSIVLSEDSIVSCHGNDGAISAQITGGINFLQGYLTWWTNSNGDTINNVLTNNFALNLHSLSADTYHLKVEDDHGCFANTSIVLHQADSLIVNASFNQINCFNGQTSILPVATGGVSYSPYQFLINNNTLLSSYPAGIYTVQVSDAKSCTATTTIELLQPELIQDSSFVISCQSYSWNGVTYTQSGVYTATFASTNGCDSIHTIHLTLEQGIRLAMKVILSGPYIGNGMMHDTLRVTGQIPLSEPYTLLNFLPIGYAGGETISPSMLALSGNNAIVDWVHVELRSGAPSYNKVASINALLQRDGDVVDVNGNHLYFNQLCPGNYFVSIKHRNHIGVMSATSIMLNNISTPLVDFTTSNSVWVKPGVANPPRKSEGGYFLLWSGDTRTDKNVKYNGLNNDKDPIIYAVGLATPNQILYPVYRTEDVNMDARVKYNNADNDKNFMLNQVIMSNANQSANNVISQHVPN